MCYTNFHGLSMTREHTTDRLVGGASASLRYSYATSSMRSHRSRRTSGTAGPWDRGVDPDVAVDKARGIVPKARSARDGVGHRVASGTGVGIAGRERSGETGDRERGCGFGG
jgi:hypothetical protein